MRLRGTCCIIALTLASIVKLNNDAARRFDVDPGTKKSRAALLCHPHLTRTWTKRGMRALDQSGTRVA